MRTPDSMMRPEGLWEATLEQRNANSKRNLGFQQTSIPRNRPLSLQARLSS